jgi:GNAT superfamily N-acetyltransferase
MGMTTIRDATSGDTEDVRALFWEYLQWANRRVNEEFGVNFDIDSMLDRDMAHLEIFSQPDGQIVLAIEGAQVAGIGGLKRLLHSTAEIKRMYVRPAFRGQGLGRELLAELIAEAKRIGYQRIRLDSAGFMVEAHSLYRSAGFREIDPYPESEIPPDFQRHWVFMEKEL